MTSILERGGGLSFKSVLDGDVGHYPEKRPLWGLFRFWEKSNDFILIISLLDFYVAAIALLICPSCQPGTSTSNFLRIWAKKLSLFVDNIPYMV